ncbi:hypothetical protein RHODGE_RHODGE_00298 [Rhodoplanes serenus]|uniref:Uncharacterized protein n=1 Tax=Rhodoplanes serenus TaxID=200615 RepID=A0A447CPS6_9BRAD|nr:hypothetical protein [Rhodoplanes serenus]VCU07192.1 hypothetical protein RHODGE_RHODGE_00298 [Rhodoplanes serenus]
MMDVATRQIVAALAAGEALPSLQRGAAEIIGRQAEEIATLRLTLRHLEAWSGVHETDPPATEAA